MERKNSYRLSVIIVVGAIGYSLAGVAVGFYRLVCLRIGAYDALAGVYPAVVLGSMCIGLMAPQWLIRRFLRMTRRGIRSTGGKKGPGRLNLWLPDGRVETEVARAALTGSILIWILLSIAVGLLSGTAAAAGVWIQDRFLLTPAGLQILDVVLLFIWQFPLWMAAGVILALLYRSVLSVESDLPACRISDWGMPAALILGLGLGFIFRPEIFLPAIGQRSAIWPAEIPALAASLYLILRKPEGKHSPALSAAYPSHTAVAEKVTPDGLAVSGRVMFCGALAGGTMVIWGHLMTLIGAGGAGPETLIGIFLLAMAGGYRLGAGRDDSSESVRYTLSGLLLLWSFAGLLGALIWAGAGRQGDGLSGAGGRGLTTAVLWLAVLGQMTLAGATLARCRPLVQAGAVNRSPGWARWLRLLGAGAALGWFISYSAMLPAYGSLLCHSFWVLAALMVGGLGVIYQGGGRVRFQRGMIAGGFALIVLNSVLIPWAGKNWLWSTEGEKAIVCEVPGRAWVITPAKPGGKVKSMALPVSAGNGETMRSGGAESSRRLYETIAGAAGKVRVLIAGLEENFWPPGMGDTEPVVDYLLEGSLYRGLRKLGCVPTDNKGNYDFAALDIVPEPLELHLRCTGNRYDVVWLRWPESDLEDHKNIDVDFWDRFRRRMHFNGMILIQVEGRNGSMGRDESFVKRYSGIFQGRGGILESDQPGKDDESKTVFILAFAYRQGWEGFLREQGYSISEPPPERSPIIVLGLGGAFSCF